jgi:hypothetical protein
VQLLQGVDTGKQVSKINPDQSNLRLVKNASVPFSVTQSPEKDRSLFELDSTVMGSPSPLKNKQNRRTRFSFKKAVAKDVIDPVVQGMSDPSASPVLTPSLNVTAQMESITNRDLEPSARANSPLLQLRPSDENAFGSRDVLLPSARETRANSPLLKVRPSDETVSKIDLGEETSNNTSNNIMGSVTLFGGLASAAQKDLTETSPMKIESSQPDSPGPLGSPAQRLVTPDKDKSFLERAKLRRRKTSFKKVDEDEMVFALSDHTLKESGSPKDENNKSEHPSSDEPPLLKSTKSIRRKRISRIDDD